MQCIKKHALYLAWAVSLAAMFGSLYFSNVRGFPPCVLCWYQRIFMYPLVFILGIAILKKDAKVYRYALPLAVIGWLIAAYHNLLYWKIIPDSLAPCVTGVSCTTKYIEWFGFVTIPFLSFLAFTAVILLMYRYKKNFYENK